MSNWYTRAMLSRLDREMGSKELEETRRDTLSKATGAVLEIGVGPGYNIPLYPHIDKLYALEPVEELRALAKARAASAPFPVEFLTSGAEAIALPDESVDTVVSTWTMCSVAGPKQTLKEVHRVLRPHGRFLFADHGAAPSHALHVVQTILTSLTKHCTGNCHYDRPIAALITEAGLVMERLEHPPESGKPLMYNYQGIASKRG